MNWRRNLLRAWVPFQPSGSVHRYQTLEPSSRWDDALLLQGVRVLVSTQRREPVRHTRRHIRALGARQVLAAVHPL